MMWKKNLNLSCSFARLGSKNAIGFAIDLVGTPRGLGDNAGEVGALGTVQDAARAMSHALVGPDDDAGQIGRTCRPPYGHSQQSS